MARQNGANDKQIQELLLQALEHEKGGVKVYETALECVINEDLREEWTKYLEETHRHVEILTETARELGLEPDTETPGRATGCLRLRRACGDQGPCKLAPPPTVRGEGARAMAGSAQGRGRRG